MKRMHALENIYSLLKFFRSFGQNLFGCASVTFHQNEKGCKIVSDLEINTIKYQPPSLFSLNRTETYKRDSLYIYKRNIVLLSFGNLLFTMVDFFKVSVERMNLKHVSDQSI